MAKQHVFRDKGETRLTVLFRGDVYIYLLTAFVWFRATHQAILSMFPLQVFATSGPRLALPPAVGGSGQQPTEKCLVGEGQSEVSPTYPSGPFASLSIHSFTQEIQLQV